MPFKNDKIENDSGNTNNNKLKKKAAVISLIVGLGMFASKMIAFLITDSSAIFSDAAESVVHVMATAMALYSIILSARPPDKSHLYGHSNIEYFSAGIEGFLILLAAGTIIYTSIERIILGIAPEKLDVGIMIIAGAGIVNVFLGFYLIRKGKETNSLALTADGKHVLTDSYTSIGVVIGLVLVLLTDFILLDPLFAIFVALNIVYTGYKLVRESVGGLMNETDTETLRELVTKLNVIKRKYWIDLHHLRFWNSADKIFIDFHLILPYYFDIKKAHLEEEFILGKIQEDFSNAEIRIHTDYCDDSMCKLCNYDECDVRKEKKSQSIIWDLDKLIGNPVHD